MIEMRHLKNVGFFRKKIEFIEIFDFELVSSHVNYHKAYYKTSNHQPLATNHRLSTTDPPAGLPQTHKSPTTDPPTSAPSIHRPSKIDQRPTSKCSTNPLTIDHRPTNRSSTNPPITESPTQF